MTSPHRFPLRHCFHPVVAALGLLLGTALAAAESARLAFDLPAGDAAQTLKLFAEQARREILFPVQAVTGVQTNPVRGTFAVSEALTRLLEGTALSAVEDAKSGAIVVRKEAIPPAPPKKVETTAAAPVRTEENALLTLDPYAVTVTVQKRPQDAQEVPIAMTSLSYTALERFRVTTLRDLSRLAPNVLVSSFNQSSPTIAIRGATNTFSQIGVNKPVAVVIDDVFVPRNSAATFELFDLDSVQVLRGPQGTLFGRNVTGGAIVLNTRQPLLRDYAAATTLEVGNFGDRKFQGMLSVPLGETAAASVTALTHTHDGYGRDRLTGREQDDLDTQAVRGQVLVQPSQDLKVLLRADYSDDRNGGRTLSSKGVGNDGDRRTSELGLAQDYARIIWGGSAQVELRTAWGDFTSISAYRESQSGETYSGTGTSYTFLTTGSQSINRDLDNPGTFSEELRYASPKWGWGDFVAGLYCVDEAAHRNLQISALAAGTGAVVTNQNIDQKVDTRSLGTYLDGTWDVTKTIELTVGGRYTTDTKEAALVRVDLRTPAAGFTASGLSHRWSEFTPRGVLAWEPGENLKVYVSATRGFTSGGYNTEAATAAIAAVSFAPETVTSYELGVKTKLWQNRLRANLALFDSAYEDKQELYFNSVTRVLTILNASEATMRGAELELLFTPTNALAFNLAYGYLDAAYDSFVVPGVLNNTGNPLGSAPRGKFSAGFDYQLPVREIGRLSFTASYSWTDDYYTGATKDPNLLVPAYSLVNASVNFEMKDGRWRFSLWGRNLADEEYLLTPSTQGVLAEYLGEPRTYGASLSWRL